MKSHFQMKGWAARLVLNWHIPKDVKMFFIKVGLYIVIFFVVSLCLFFVVVVVFFLFFFSVCACVFHIFFQLCDLTPCSRWFPLLSQALAVYGQVTGKPKDDPPPPPAGLPDPTTKDPEPSDDQTRKGSDVETEKGKPSASLASDFREVEGSSKDVHMRWKPPVSSRSHFTAAASPTRARDFWVCISTVQLSNYFLRVLKSERHVACTPAKI